MKKQSYAHELADELDDWSDGPDTHLLTEKAATELRRLQEANVDCTDHFNALKKDFDDLRAENEQLKANKQIQSNVAGDLGKALRDLIEKADDAEIRRLDPHKLVKLVVAVCAEEVTRELTAFGDNGDFLFGHFGISKE